MEDPVEEFIGKAPESLAEADALRIALLALRPDAWIHRRVDEITYLDDRSIRRRISVDLTVPRGNATARADAVMYLPIAQFAKEPLTRFDFADTAGESIPMLTAQQNGALSVAMLRALARVPDPNLVDMIVDTYIEVLVFSVDDRAKSEAFRKIFGDDTSIGRLLSRFPPFVALAQELAQNFVVFLPVLHEHIGERRIIKMAFDAPERSPRPRRISQRLGWAPVEDTFDVPAAGSAASYHVEIVPPPDMRVAEGSFVGRKDGKAVVHRIVRPSGRAHFNLSGLDRGSLGVLRASVHAESGIFGGAALFAAICFGTLLFVRLRIKDFSKQDSYDAVVAALLAGPAIAIAYIARPSEHPIVSRFLAWVRYLAMGCAVASFAGAIVLFAGYSVEQLDRIYLVLCAVSGICAAGLVMSWLSQLLRR